jgi:hypothetical protein
MRGSATRFTTGVARKGRKKRIWGSATRDEGAYVRLAVVAEPPQKGLIRTEQGLIGRLKNQDSDRGATSARVRRHYDTANKAAAVRE